jgi:acetolactate synthase-1/2/3 large subunit
MARPLDASPLRRHAPVQPDPGSRELQRAADLIDAAENPLVLAGNGAIPGHASRALRSFVHNTGIPVAESFMAKGLID